MSKEMCLSTDTAELYVFVGVCAKALGAVWETGNSSEKKNLTTAILM